MSINNTGIPDTKDYLIGRGILKAALLNDDGTPQSFKDLGNIPEMVLTVDSEKYEHFSSRAGLKVLDKSVVIEQTANASFILENIQDFGNLKLFFSGTAETRTNAATAGFAGSVIAQDGTIEANAYYLLVDLTSLPVLNVDVANVTIETTNLTPIELVQGTDYTIDAFSGEIFLKDTATVQTAISGDEGLTFDYAADANATEIDVLSAQTVTAVTVALRFVSEDADTGIKKMYDIHKSTLAADGDYNLISDEVTQAPMTASVEKSSNVAYTGTITISAPKDRTV